MYDNSFPQRNKGQAPRSIDVLIAEFARAQHGLITSAQLRACGISNSAASRRTRTGNLHRVHRGVYAVGHAALSDHARWLAAVLASGAGAALSHEGAASLWAMWRRQPGAVDVTTPRQLRDTKARAWRLHTSRSLTARDTTVRQGIPVTTVAHTLLDLGDVLSAHQLANVMHEAAFRRPLSTRAIDDVVRRNRGRRAVTVLGEAWALHRSGSAGTRSQLEDRFLSLLGQLGVPRPMVNVHVPVADTAIEVDFHWPSHMLCVEVDGSGHARARTRVDDERRDRRLGDAGFAVLRCDSAELARCARRVARIVL